MPLAVAPGTRAGINWSGCVGDAGGVPVLVGLTFGATVTPTMRHCPR